MKIIDKDGYEVTTIDFGMPEIGKTHTYSYTLVNDTPFKVINIKIEVFSPLVTLDYPKELAPMEQSTIIFTYSPPLDFKRKLETYIKSTYTEVYE
jgi:hypothetical protein